MNFACKTFNLTVNIKDFCDVLSLTKYGNKRFNNHYKSLITTLDLKIPVKDPKTVIKELSEKLK